MNDEGAPDKGAPDKPRSSVVEDTTADGVRIPSVSLIVPLEADPRIVVDAENDAGRAALFAWVRSCRPDTHRFLQTIASELRDKKPAA